MLKFLTSKPLWVNILAGIAVLLLLLLLFLGSLSLLTQHGKTMKIPTVTGMQYDRAKKTLETAGFDVQIQDSVYSDTMPPSQVVKQFPEADNLVKVNRTVYLTINRAEAPLIQMPNLVSMSFRNANMVLKQYGLRLEDTLFKPNFAKNSVLDQLYKGETIKPGSQIRQGSAITLVLGNGIGDKSFIIPDLTGLSYREAKARLDSLNLIFGAVVPNADVSDPENAFIYKQDPSPGKLDESGRPILIRAGQSIDIWIGAQRPAPRVDSPRTQPAGGGY